MVYLAGQQVSWHISMAIEASCPIRWYIWLGWHLSVVWAGWMVYPRGWLKYILGSIYHQSASLLGSFLRNCIDILYSYWYTKCLPSIFCHLFPHLHLLPSITSMAILTIFLALPCPSLPFPSRASHDAETITLSNSSHSPLV